MTGNGVVYISVFGQVDLERLSVVLEAQGGHGKQDILAVNCFALFLVAFLGGCSVLELRDVKLRFL